MPSPATAAALPSCVLEEMPMQLFLQRGSAPNYRISHLLALINLSFLIEMEKWCPISGLECDEEVLPGKVICESSGSFPFPSQLCDVTINNCIHRGLGRYFFTFCLQVGSVQCGRCRKETVQCETLLSHSVNYYALSKAQCCRTTEGKSRNIVTRRIAHIQYPIWREVPGSAFSQV